jgi:uncharacterized protein YjbJ (UPF0337 family)
VEALYRYVRQRPDNDRRTGAQCGSTDSSAHSINIKEDRHMNKDRIEGVVKQVTGSVKEAAGKILGDAKLQTDGKAEKAAGSIQNAVGGVEDALKK